mgnify:CR=1 FL=1
MAVDCMIIALIGNDKIHSISLPRKISGRYWIIDRDEAGRFRQVADVEGIQDHWLLHGSAILGLTDTQRKEVETIKLTGDVQIINAFYRKDRAPVQLLVEPASDDRQTYRKFRISGACRLNIGRTEDNQIVFDNQYVSAHHACLIWERGCWSITDTQSRNGTFVNNQRIATKQLWPGDAVYIMGLRIIVGEKFFAANNPDGNVTIQSDKVACLAAQEEQQEKDFTEPLSQERFFRSPRLQRSVIKGELRVDAPPSRDKAEEIPPALMLGPALTMGMTAVVMGTVAVLNLNSGRSDLLSAVPTIVMAASMLCGTLLWPFLTKRYEKKKRASSEEIRRGRYFEYLDQVKDIIFTLAEEQKNVLLENHPSTEECGKRILRRSRSLWERTIDEEDFLSLRLGLGDVPLQAEIHFPERRFAIEDDALQNELNRLADAPKLLRDAPITVSLLRHAVIGIAGDRPVSTAFLQALILQIIALHSGDEVKLVFLVNDDEQAEWKYAGLLPHTWSDERDERYLASTSEDAKALAMILERVIQDRIDQQGNGKTTGGKPHYVVIAADAQLAYKTGIFSRIHECPEGVGISCLTIADHLMDLPKECSAVVELAEEKSILYDRRNHSRRKTEFCPEGIGKADLDGAAAILANIVVDSGNAILPLPTMLTFLEMNGVGKTEHLNALNRWKENNPVNTLQAPVGVSQDGSPFYLDLHEKSHGPHGLIAGMTGSGKSEFIITFILSLAVNYHPDEVAFILIDYKGGGLAGAFEDSQSGIRLPHLAGTITNLDGAAVNRALISIQSELRRRQAVFNEARRVSGEGTIDIYKYQKMYRSGLVREPVPHLFIISDEFAELKAQQPEFMSQLISTARIGRSLGVHLILATQKPSGVVDDQIWSNSRFRVCLKVQERADSVEMLRRPDAAELKNTGRFYLQVGFNELFELGQSAWCGAPYFPAECVEKKRDDSVEVIDHLGRVLAEAKHKAVRNIESQGSQVVSIVRYLSDLAREEHISTRQLWLPQIPAVIYLEDLKNKYGWKADALEIAPIIGEYDDPARQSQGILSIPLTKEGNALIYGIAGSGKTTLLNTLMVGLLSEYSARKLHIYVVDMGEENLQVFAGAPQVGDVLLSSDVEKIQTLFKMIRDEIARRKKLFAGGDGSYVGYCSAGNELPQILIVLRNYAAFMEQFEQLDELLIQITRDCNKYGIYFLMTANAANSVRYRVAQNFANIYALELNDVSDYIGLFGGTNGVYPSKIKGRGLFKSSQVYEFQVAHYGKDPAQSFLPDFVRRLKDDAAFRAKPVPSLPDRVTPSFFQDDYRLDSFPIGVEKRSLRTSFVNWDQAVISTVLALDTEELGMTVQGIVELLSRLSGTVTVMDGAGILEESPSFAYSYIGSNFAGCVEAIFSEMVRRNHTYKKALADYRSTEPFEAQYYVITGLQSILDSLTDDGREKLNALLEKGELAYNMRFLLCENIKAMSEFTSAAWYRRHVSGSEGIWVGDGIADQYLLKIGKIANHLYSELPPNFGYVVKKGRPVLVKLVVGEQSKEAVE